ncbi:SGNH/GDSL hydrolase family protein [bacterium]|nr:MAG: SGNH/GDSL hydrolase family protein [bacterium]
MHVRLSALVAALAAVLVTTTSAAAAPGQYQAPRKYYLALGDSLAFGFELAKFDAELPNVTAASFDTGYVDDFAAAIHSVRPDVRVVNFGCPGETTSSYFTGCAWHAVKGLPLHDTYATAQEAAALAFLNAHPGEVSPITIDLGANDVLGLAAGCNFVPSCLAQGAPAVLQSISTNLSTTLAELRAAAPRGEIIVMEYYNPLYVVAPSTDALLGQLNGVIAAAAAPYGARLADAFPVINHNPAFPSEGASVCGLTGMCFPAPGGDIHPNDAGYALIAQRFWAASGYALLDG